LGNGGNNDGIMMEWENDVKKYPNKLMIMVAETRCIASLPPRRQKIFIKNIHFDHV
jgi:hypothetical protein